MSRESYLDPHPRHRDPWSLGRASDYLNGRGHGLPAMWTDSRFLVFDADVDAGTARRWLPPGLRPSDPARARIFAVDYVRTGLGFDYREVGVLLHATLRKKPVLHVAWMVVDDDTAMTLGRELLGFPKKMARIEVEVGEASARAIVRRRGVDLLTIRADLGEPIAETKVFPQRIVNVRGIPSLMPDMLLRMDPGECFHSGRAAEFEVQLKESAFDPLAELGLAGSQRGFHAVADIGPTPPSGRPRLRTWPFAGFVRPTWLMRAYPFRSW
jgi:acetoacetate decarboxylase